MVFRHFVESCHNAEKRIFFTYNYYKERTMLPEYEVLNLTEHSYQLTKPSPITNTDTYNVSISLERRLLAQQAMPRLYAICNLISRSSGFDDEDIIISHRAIIRYCLANETLKDKLSITDIGSPLHAFTWQRTVEGIRFWRFVMEKLVIRYPSLELNHIKDNYGYESNRVSSLRAYNTAYKLTKDNHKEEHSNDSE